MRLRVPLSSHEKDVSLQVRGICVPLNDVRKARVCDHGCRPCVEPLISPEELIAGPESLELASNDRLKGGSNDRPGHMPLRQAPHEEINVLDTAVDVLQIPLQDGIAREGCERLVRRQPNGFTGLVERPEADVPASLNVDGDQIDLVDATPARPASNKFRRVGTV